MVDKAGHDALQATEEAVRPAREVKDDQKKAEMGACGKLGTKAQATATSAQATLCRGYEVTKVAVKEYLVWVDRSCRCRCVVLWKKEARGKKGTSMLAVYGTNALLDY